MRMPLLLSVVLVVTALSSIATSRPPCSGNVPETRIFRVGGECGPLSVISITSDSNCQLTIDAGDSQLPSRGEMYELGTIVGQRLRLQDRVFLPDGGRIPLRDGGVRPAPTSEETGLCSGCPDNVGNTRTCNASSTDGGLELTVICTTDTGANEETCTSLMAPF